MERCHSGHGGLNMRVLIVGGGPGGLFLALLAKRARPDLEVRVLEQNPDGATYGWGVVFSESAIAALRPAAPDVLDEISARKPPVEHMEVTVGAASASVNGHPFFRIGRVGLLGVLQRHAHEAGVELVFEQRVSSVEQLAGWDLVVGADGVNSAVRELFEDDFAPAVTFGTNMFAWYGTERSFEPVSLMFEPTDTGLFVGHAYEYEPGMSGFVAEVSPRVYEKAGLGELSDEQSRAFCSQVFARHLDGHELLSNRSLWFQPKFVTCRNWHRGNVTLLGDALHTVHPSIGSGTRFAMRDAVALADAIGAEGDDVDAILRTYENGRRPTADAFQAAARRSIAWYENLAERDLGDPTQVALEYIMRTGRVRYEQFRAVNPELVAAYEQPGLAARRAPAGVASGAGSQA